MVFNVIIILLIAGITYWHMTQGFFSATLSALCAVLAAVMAVSYTLKSDRLNPSDKQSIWIFPVDDIVCSVVDKLSNGGSLAGDTPFSAVHPNYPDELFAQRLGVQVGARHTTLNLPGVAESVK